MRLHDGAYVSQHFGGDVAVLELADGVLAVLLQLGAQHGVGVLVVVLVLGLASAAALIGLLLFTPLAAQTPPGPVVQKPRGAPPAPVLVEGQSIETW